MYTVAAKDAVSTFFNFDGLFNVSKLLEVVSRLKCGSPRMMNPRKLPLWLLAFTSFVLLFATSLFYGGPAFGVNLLGSSNNGDAKVPISADADPDYRLLRIASQSSPAGILDSGTFIYDDIDLQQRALSA